MPVGLAASRKSGERARLWIDIPDARLPADRVAGSAGFVVVLFFMVGFGAALETPRHGVRRTVLALMGVLSTGVFWSCSGRSTQGGDGAAEDGGADGGATDGGATGPVSEDNFLQKVADALCGNVGACCTAAGIPYDRAGCEAFVFEEFERPPNSTWDAVAAEKCLEGFERLAASCYEVVTDDRPCTRVYRGTLPEGAACEDRNECADIRGSKATCAWNIVTRSYTCAVDVERGRAGDPCKGTCDSSGCNGFNYPVDAECYVEDGLVCSLRWTACVPTPVLGEFCDAVYNCAAGMYCSNFLCVASRPDGEVCVFDEECIGGNCVDSQCGRRSVASTEICNGQ